MQRHPLPDKLTVQVNVTVYGSKRHQVWSTCEPSSERSTVLSTLLLDGMSSDFTLLVRSTTETSEGGAGKEWVRIPTHRLVLTLRSPVLRAMLQSGMAESAAGELRIEDFEASVVREFVRYLCTDTCEVAPHTESLLAMAHYFQVPQLQRCCEHRLLMQLDTSSIAHVCTLADTYQSTELTKGAARFIAAHATTLLCDRSLLASLSTGLCQEVLGVMAGMEHQE